MSKVIDTFPKNAMEEVRTQLTEYKGYKLIDIRVWYKQKEEEEFKPSKKGLTLGIEHYKELKKAILKVGDELEGKAQARGLSALVLTLIFSFQVLAGVPINGWDKAKFGMC